MIGLLLFPQILVQTPYLYKSHQAGKVTSFPWHGGDTEKSHQVVESQGRRITMASRYDLTLALVLGFDPSDFWRDPLTQPQALACGTLVTTEDDTHARQASLQKTCQMLASRLHLLLVNGI